MATHSNILAWRIPWTEEPHGGSSPWGRKGSDILNDFHFQAAYSNCWHDPQKKLGLLSRIVVQSLSHVQHFCDPHGWQPARSSVHGIFQARIFEWAAISNFRGSSQLRYRKSPCFLHWQAVLTTQPPGKPGLLFKNGLLWERINNTLKCHFQQIQGRDQCRPNNPSLFHLRISVLEHTQKCILVSLVHITATLAFYLLGVSISITQ